MGLILYQLVEHLPFLIVSGVIFLLTLKLFLPNPRRFGWLIGWLFAEVIEHLVVPLMFLYIATKAPFRWDIILFVLVFLVYGFIVGRIKTLKDFYGVLLIFIVFRMIVVMPSILLFISQKLDIAGKYILVFILISSIIIYYLSS